LSPMPKIIDDPFDYTQGHAERAKASRSMKKRIKINGIIIFCTFWLVVLFPAIFLRVEKTTALDFFAAVCGIAFILFGQTLRISARGFKSEHSRNSHALVTGGPYGLVRNPMYLGILLIGLGIVLAIFNWWVAAIFILIFFMRYLLLIFKEEKKIIAAFPGDFPAYQKKIPRILPGMGTLAREDIAAYLPLKLDWFKRELPSICPVLLVTIILVSWIAIKNQGVFIYLGELAGILAVLVLFTLILSYAAGKSKNIKQ